MHVNIRKAKISDINKLVEIGVLTFIETFSEMNSEKDMEKYLEESFNYSKIRSEIDKNGSLFFLAEEGEVPVAYMKINMGNAQTENMGNKWIEIERLYVQNESKSKGIGTLLMKKAIEIARKKNLDYLWLGVWEHNHPAQKFYRKFGFEKFGEHIFMLGTDAQTDWLMKVKKESVKYSN